MWQMELWGWQGPCTHKYTVQHPWNKSVWVGNAEGTQSTPVFYFDINQLVINSVLPSVWLILVRPDISKFNKNVCRSRGIIPQMLQWATFSKNSRIFLVNQWQLAHLEDSQILSGHSFQCGWLGIHTISFNRKTFQSSQSLCLHSAKWLIQ